MGILYEWLRRRVRSNMLERKIQIELLYFALQLQLLPAVHSSPEPVKPASHLQEKESG